MSGKRDEQKTIPPAGTQPEKSPFDYFHENIARLQADPNFRQILKEFDEGQKETLSLLVSDAAAFLKYRGVQLPQDFRVSVGKKADNSVNHGGGGGYIVECEIIELCFLRWCVVYMHCRIVERIA